MRRRRTYLSKKLNRLRWTLSPRRKKPSLPKTRLMMFNRRWTRKRRMLTWKKTFSMPLILLT